MREPVNLAEYRGISKKNEKMTVWNSRRHIDRNIVPNHLKTMTKRLFDGTDVKEDCFWEGERFTLIGKSDLIFNFY